MPIGAARRWHTSTFRWLAVYAAIFSVSIASLVGAVTCMATSALEREADQVLHWQLIYFDSIDDIALPGIINARLERERMHANFYGLFAANGRPLAGDVIVFPPGIEPNLAPVTLKGDLLISDTGNHVASAHAPLVRAMAERRPDGRVLIVARDLSHIAHVRDTIIRALLIGGALCLAGGIIVGLVLSVRQLRRVRGIRRATLRISQGHLHQRLPVGGRDEIDLLAHLVNHMLDEVERLMHEVKDACDGIAHDLRTPLAHVRGLLGQIAEQPAARDAPATLALVEQARAQSDLLLMRFKAMLRISEIGSLQRRGGFAQVDLQGLIEEVGAFYEPLAQSCGVAWRVVTEPVGLVHGDRALLFEAFSNVLDNAIKFAGCDAMGDTAEPASAAGEPARSTAKAEVSLCLRRSPQGPVVEIVDNGPGIAADERQAVLQPFYRSERTMHVDGSGLGLGVVMAVLRVHDFSLHIYAPHVGDPVGQKPDRPGARMVIECWPQTLA